MTVSFKHGLVNFGPRCAPLGYARRNERYENMIRTLTVGLLLLGLFTPPVAADVQDEIKQGLKVGAAIPQDLALRDQ